MSLGGEYASNLYVGSELFGKGNRQPQFQSIRDQVGHYTGKKRSLPADSVKPPVGVAMRSSCS